MPEEWISTTKRKKIIKKIKLQQQLKFKDYVLRKMKIAWN